MGQPRHKRGLSQLDLALAADVSARHISFLETGRSRPSEAMVHRIARTLGVPLRHVNALLQAAGYEAAYPEHGGALPPAVRSALDLLKRHQDPFPLVVVDRTYRIQDLNDGARAMLSAALGPDVDLRRLNLARLSFDPDGAQALIANFDAVGRALLWRLQREVLADPEDQELRELLDAVLAMPTVDAAWREVDLGVPSEPVLELHLRAGGQELRFTTLVTTFQAPQNVAVEELRVESWFPADEVTAQACRALHQAFVGG